MCVCVWGGGGGWRRGALISDKPEAIVRETSGARVCSVMKICCRLRARGGSGLAARQLAISPGPARSPDSQRFICSPQARILRPKRDPGRIGARAWQMTIRQARLRLLREPLLSQPASLPRPISQPCAAPACPRRICNKTKWSAGPKMHCETSVSAGAQLTQGQGPSSGAWAQIHLTDAPGGHWRLALASQTTLG